MVGFVDDSAGQTFFFDNDATPEELMKLSQQDAQLWSDLLWLLGGLLELDKCSYHFIYYTFLNNGSPVMVSQHPGPALEVTKLNTTIMITIKYKNAYTAHKTLGHRKAPAGVNALQKMVLVDKANGYAVKASASSLTYSEEKLYYDNCYLKSVGYVLGQCFFTD
eukprot:15349002-Ditylum_brightwellii.AAC.1